MALITVVFAYMPLSCGLLLGACGRAPVTPVDPANSAIAIFAIRHVGSLSTVFAFGQAHITPLHRSLELELVSVHGKAAIKVIDPFPTAAGQDGG